MNYRVIILPEAEEDLIAIYRYVADNDSINNAEKLLDKIEAVCSALSDLPERGHAVPELKRVHVATFREVHFKPYRVVYQIIGGKVFVHAVLDGRRELQELLEKRVIR